ncbi:Uncharacterized protein DBV15_02990 [Temnothorax longispinosus]|uniref:Uncharacterized protein n=1 Tax=Temnothorax longispinosus TaxID=300112 RepID=A0A4S2KCL3_9HYME|nr:Uncharacterized protein DBV15_02990 [Temnothorax longispinosus]
MYLRDRNNITPDPTRRRGRGTTTGPHSPLEQCSSRCSSTSEHIRLGYMDSYFLKRASRKRKTNRLSVDIFHGKRELSRIHGCSARGKKAIKSARASIRISERIRTATAFLSLKLFTSHTIQ